MAYSRDYRDRNFDSTVMLPNWTTPMIPVPVPVPEQHQSLQERNVNAGNRQDPKAEPTKRGRKTHPHHDKQNSSGVPSAADLSGVHLDGEEDEEAPIFDTCDDIRKKFNEALKSTTQANLACTLSELLPKSSVNSRQLSSFLKFKGPQAGAHSIAFYAGWVYFEKLRIKEGKKKSAKREKMEEIWGGARPDDKILTWGSKGSRLGGFPREGSHKARLTCMSGERWRLNQYGEVQISG